MAPVDFRKLAGLSIIRLTVSILIRAVHQLRYLHGWPAVCSALTGFSFHHQPLLSLHLNLPSKASQHGEERGNAARPRTMLYIADRTIRPWGSSRRNSFQARKR
jgi:hypothetical protein